MLSWRSFCILNSVNHWTGRLINQMDINDESINRREFSRIDTYIPLIYRLVPQEEEPLVRSRISGDVMLTDFRRMPPLTDHPRWSCLDQLNEKIDRIIHLLTIQYEGFESLSFKFITISGNGMKFSSHQQFSAGDLLEFKMILNLHQPVFLYVYGKVIHVEKQTSGYFISAHFQMMDDTVRELVVRFIFEMEREALRDRQKEVESL